jgi:excisionase family DNA binding protein
MKAIPDKEFFTPKEVWELLEVHKTTVYRWIEGTYGPDWTLRCIRIGRKVAIPREALVEFLERATPAG